MNYSSVTLKWILFPFAIFCHLASAQINGIDNLQNQEVSFSYEQTYKIQFIEHSSLDEVIVHLPINDYELKSFTVEPIILYKTGHLEVSPNVFNYNVRSISDPTIHGKLTVSGEFSFGTIISENGIHSFYPTNTSAITPYSTPALKQKKKDCHSHKGIQNLKTYGTLKSAENISSGTIKRTFDVAIVTTGEFFINNGNNLPQVEGVIANTVNAWNLIFGKDLAVEFNLLPPQIYTDPNTDPFIEDLSGGNPIPQQAAEAIDAHFNESVYDIGHVFHNTTGTTNWTDGGIAGVETACDNSSTPFSGSGPMKAANWSGSLSNVGNAFISLSAHEMGHPLGATHTFNGLGNNCTTSSVDANNSYEIGSGTTLMAYNGLCDPNQNIPSGGADDNYFHAVSINQILTYINSLSCDTEVPTGNTPPECSIPSAGIDFSVPYGTPFELTGIATDADGDQLLYTFEQYDEDGSGTFTMGKIGLDAANDPAAPLFRSMPPTNVPSRTFPDLTNILAGNNNGDDFEALPLASRDMTFVFTARDCNPNGGGVCTASITVDVNSSDPFEIASQNTPTTWVANGTSTTIISWAEMANPCGFQSFGCSEGDILFSIDGGQTFPYTLASNVDLNEFFGAPIFCWDNEHEIIIPNLPTTQGRIKIKCSDGIFFDINNANITITSSCAANGTIIEPNSPVEEFEGSPDLNLSLTPDFGSLISNFAGTIQLSDPISSLAFNESGNCGGPGNPMNYDIYDFQVGVNGLYTFNFAGGANGLIMNIYNGAFDPLNVCNGWVASSGSLVSPGLIDDNDNLLANLNANSPYQLVVSSFDNSPAIPILPRNYSINTSGGDIYNGVPQPPAGFDYAFVIVDQNSGLIKDITTTPDLSSAVNYPQGDYKVFGLSWDIGSTLPAPGSSFNDFISDIINSLICAQLSNNFVVVSVTCPPSDDDDGDGICNAFDVCPGGDDTIDSDGDGIPDDCDSCFGNNASGDTDSDGICDDEDEFPNGGCGISEEVDLSNVSPCNDAGTVNDPDDDFYTADITLYFELPPPAGATHLQIFMDLNEPPYGYFSIASVPITDLSSSTSHTFLNVEVPIRDFSTTFRLDFNDGSSNLAFDEFSSCDQFAFIDISMEECSCEEIYIEFLEVNCVDPNNTPGDPSDDEIEYVFIANKGTAGMGSSSGGSYGIANDCQEGEGGIYCETPEVPGDFGEPNTATTGTEAGTGGGSRSFTIFYGDGCEYTVEFPDFDDFPEFDPNTEVNPCDECETDPDKLVPGICGCGNPEPGEPCDDNNPNTGYDTVQDDCSCLGAAISDEICIIDPCACLNNATNESNGQFSEVVQIESTAPGESWYILSETGFYNISSPPPPATPTSYSIGSGGIIFNSGSSDGIDNDDDGSTDEPDEEVFYTLSGIHVDGQGYNMVVSNGSQQYMIFNQCFYPDIQINLPSILSTESLPVNLLDLAIGVNIPDNIVANGVFSFDLCEPDGTIIQTDISELAIGLNPGNYLLKSTFNEEDVPVALPPVNGIPGCIQPKNFLFKIVAPNCEN